MKMKTVLICFFTTLMIDATSAQNNNSYMRIANIVVDSSQLESYKSALTEGMHAAVQKEKGVLSLYAVYDEKNPTNITVFETYASKKAYQLHTQTPHFKKYKATVEHMVKSLTLTDVQPIALESKP